MKHILARLLRYLILLFVLGALVAGGRFLVLRKQHRLAQAPVYGSRPTPVRVVNARRDELVSKNHYLAVVEPDRRANVSARLTATVEEVLCDEGDHVVAGQVILRLDDREILEGITSMQSDIAGAEAELAANRATEASLRESLAYWEREVTRDTTLVERGGIALSEAESTQDKASEIRGRLKATQELSIAIEHKIDSLGEQKQQAETKRTYCELKSPYDGIVTNRNVDPGDLGTPGKTLLVIEDRNRLKLVFRIPQTDLGELHEGLEVGFRAGDEVRRARLSHLHPALDTARMLRAEVYLRGPQAEGLPCGAYISLWVESGRIEDATLIPATCLVEAKGADPSVFLVEGEHLVSRTVQVLASSGAEVAVRGVEPGDSIVTSTFLGWATLSGGIRVEVVK